MEQDAIAALFLVLFTTKYMCIVAITTYGNVEEEKHTS